MSLPTREELLKRFGKADDPEMEARLQHILKVLLESSPETKQEIIDQSRRVQARAALRRVLVLRKLAPSQDEDARIEACTDLAILERWFGRAVTAVSVADALE